MRRLNWGKYWGLNSPIPFLMGVRGYNPGKIFETTNARR
jgi:hypothetical protein